MCRVDKTEGPRRGKDEDLDELLALRELPRGKQIIGSRLRKVSRAISRKYKAGATIRQLAEITGRSYGFIQGTLDNAGVERRPRGGAYRKSSAKTSER